MILSTGNILRGTFYLKFVPKTKVSSYTIFAWKVATLSGSIPGKPIALRRLKDEKTICVNYIELLSNFLLEEDYKSLALNSGYTFDKKENFLLHFSLVPSEP